MIGHFATVYKIVAAFRCEMFIYLPVLRLCVIMDCVSYEKRTLSGHSLCETTKAITATVRIFRHVSIPIERLLKLLPVRLYSCNNSRTSKRSFIKFIAWEFLREIVYTFCFEIWNCIGYFAGGRICICVCICKVQTRADQSVLLHGKKKESCGDIETAFKIDFCFLI
jgi:hypothetical protein